MTLQASYKEHKISQSIEEKSQSRTRKVESLGLPSLIVGYKADTRQVSSFQQWQLRLEQHSSLPASSLLLQPSPAATLKATSFTHKGRRGMTPTACCGAGIRPLPIPALGFMYAAATTTTPSPECNLHGFGERRHLRPPDSSTGPTEEPSVPGAV